MGKSLVATAVPAPYLAFLLLAAEENGLSGDALLQSADLTHEQVRDLDARVPWANLLTLLQRLRQSTSPDQHRAVFRSFAAGFPLFRVIAEAATNSRELLQLSIELSLPAFGALDWRLTELEDGRVELRLEVDGEQPLARELFEATETILTSLPPALGFPEVQIEAKVRGNCGVFAIRAPAEPGVVVAAVEPSRTMAELISTVQLALGSPTASSPARRGLTLALQTQLGLTRAEARVVARLARGLSPREIAVELGVSVETVRTHLKRSYAKVGVRGQAELVAAVVRLPSTLKAR